MIFEIVFSLIWLSFFYFVGRSIYRTVKRLQDPQVKSLFEQITQAQKANVDPQKIQRLLAEFKTLTGFEYGGATKATIKPNNTTNTNLPTGPIAPTLPPTAQQFVTPSIGITGWKVLLILLILGGIIGSTYILGLFSFLQI